MKKESVKVLLTGVNRLGASFMEQLTTQGHQPIILESRNLGETVYLDETYQAELILHAAEVDPWRDSSGQASERMFENNILFTKRLCEAVSKMAHKPRYFIFLSSTAVYGAQDVEEVNENHPLLARSAYGKSKIQCEEYLIDWAYENKITLSILRLPEWVANQQPNSPVHLMHETIRSGKYLSFGRPGSRRSVLSMDDLVQLLDRLPLIEGIFNLTDGYHPSLKELEEAFCVLTRQRKLKRIPTFLSYLLAKSGNPFQRVLPVSGKLAAQSVATLTFSDQKARQAFGWHSSNLVEKIKGGSA